MRQAITSIAVFLLTFLPIGVKESFAAEEINIRIFFRSFIKAQHPGKPDDTIRTEAGTHVIRAPNMIPLLVAYPSLTGTCFSTDDRDFDSNPDASARTAVEFNVRIAGRAVAVEPYAGREMMRTGITRNVDCKTGEDLQPPKQAPTSSFSIGSVRKDGFVSTFFVKAAAFDPFYDLPPPLRAPDVDFSFYVKYDAIKRLLTLVGSTDNFPAFEGYYSVDGGAWQVLLNRDPPNDATALSLIDASIGLNTTNFSVEVDISTLF